MSSSTFDSQTQANIDQWLNGNYDEVTKTEIRQMLDSHETTALTDAFLYRP
ncbi:MAG: hypothetical protein R2795_24360 [Saprospiraceae bacterium]